MKIIKGTIDFNIEDNTVVSIGKFDGLHKGHESILNKMSEYRSRGYKLCVMTFDVPPASLGMAGDKEVLTTNVEKERLFSIYGVDYLIEFPFDEQTAAIRAEEFIKVFIVDRMNAKAVVVGDDCTFGYKASGNAQMLCDYAQECGYDITVIDKLMDEAEGKEISSTYLRELINEGNVKKVYDLSYRPYFVYSQLKQVVSKINENVLLYESELSPEKVIPRSGMYYTEIFYDDCFYPAITCVYAYDRQILTYAYGTIKGLEKKPVSVAFLDRKRSLVNNTDKEEIRKMLDQDIIDGHKWYRECGYR